MKFYKTFTLALFIFSMPFTEVFANDSFAIIGDAGVWNRSAQKVRNSILKSSIRSLVIPGDNLYDESENYASVWKHWSGKGFKFDVVAIGNHNNGYQNEMNYFAMPSENYSKKVGSTRFIVLNSDNQNNLSSVKGWLDKTLKEVSEKTIFIVMHHPPVDITRRHVWTDKEQFHRVIFPIIQKYRHKLTALIVGHDHIASLHTIDGLPMIVSGAVFQPIPTVPFNYVSQERGLFVQTRWLFQKAAYWVRLDVDPANGNVWVNYVNVDDDRVDCSALISGKRLLLKTNCYKTTAAGTKISLE